MYFATKGNITKQIQKQNRQFYIDSGWVITKDENEPYDFYDYEIVNEKGNCLQPIVINGESFFGYSSYACINTKTYVEEPSRTIDGSIPNLIDHDTFIVPQVDISFSYMTMHDFRRFLKAITPNEFNVTYYDFEIDKSVTYKMYCKTREMSKIFNKGFEILAVTDQKISLVATLNDLEYLKLRYYDNVKSINPQTGSEEYILFQENNMIFGNNYSVLTGNDITHFKEEKDYNDYKLSAWYTQPNEGGLKYLPNEVLTATNDLDLYASWIKTPTEYIITYVLNGGINNSLNIHKYTYNDKNITLYNPTKSGKTFLGWFTTPSFVESTRIKSISNEKPSNITLYAKWSE